MGITAPLHQVLEKVVHVTDSPKKALSLGFPDPVHDLAITPEQDPRADDIRKWHNLPSDAFVGDMVRWFESRGWSLTVVDNQKWRGIEIDVDLNKVWQTEPYDVILDPGTVEHCFDVAQAMRNLAGALKKGGTIIHWNPMNNYINHGFYQFSPTFYHDWYGQNGWEIEMAIVSLAGIENGILQWHVQPSGIGRFGHEPVANNIVVARKTHENYMETPTQSKYLRK